MSTKATNKTTATKATATTNPLAGLPANHVFKGMESKTAKPVSAADIWAFVNGVAQGNANAVHIIPLPNCDLKAPCPLPYTNMQKQGNRATIAWATVTGKGKLNGSAVDTNTLQGWARFATKHGCSGKQLHDLVAALNGGFTPSSAHYGTAYVALAYKPKA